MFCLIFLGDIPIGSSDALKKKNKTQKGVPFCPVDFWSKQKSG